MALSGTFGQKSARGWLFSVDEVEGALPVLGWIAPKVQAGTGACTARTVAVATAGDQKSVRWREAGGSRPKIRFRVCACPGVRTVRTVHRRVQN